MKKNLWSKVWVAAVLMAAPGVLHAQQLAVVNGPDVKAKPMPELPGPPKPPHAGPAREMPNPQTELQKLTMIEGTIVKPVANDRSEYNSVVLGTAKGEVLVKFPPHLGEQLLGKNQSGERLKVNGFYRDTPEGKKEFQFVSAEVNGKTLNDTPPSPPKEMAQPDQKVVSASIQALTYTPKKDINGFVLSSGEQVMLPPHIGQQLAGQLRAGEKITVSGFTEPKRSGVVYSRDVKLFKAQTLTINGQAYLIK